MGGGGSNEWSGFDLNSDFDFDFGGGGGGGYFRGAYIILRRI